MEYEEKLKEKIKQIYLELNQKYIFVLRKYQLAIPVDQSIVSLETSSDPLIGSSNCPMRRHSTKSKKRRLPENFSVFKLQCKGERCNFCRRHRAIQYEVIYLKQVKGMTKNNLVEEWKLYQRNLEFYFWNIGWRLEMDVQITELLNIIYLYSVSQNKGINKKL